MTAGFARQRRSSSQLKLAGDDEIVNRFHFDNSRIFDVVVGLSLGQRDILLRAQVPRGIKLRLRQVIGTRAKVVNDEERFTDSDYFS